MGIDIPSICIGVKRTNHNAIRASKARCQIAVFKSNQREKRNQVHQRFDVRNWDGAGDTSLFKHSTSTSRLVLHENCHL